MLYCRNAQELHRNIELVGAFCLGAGLVAMQLNNPNIYTQMGIYCWAMAQIILVIWWTQRVSNPMAAIYMGIANIGGSLFFLAGGIIFKNYLGIFISCCYIASSSLQFISGFVRLERVTGTYFGSRVEGRILARKILILVGCFQALAGMCFIILGPIAGIFYTTAAFTSLIGNILVLHETLLKHPHSLADVEAMAVTAYGEEPALQT